MIDMHTHILPHMDDGAKDTDTSIAMLRAEKQQGADTVLLTSHFYGKSRSPQEFLERRNRMYEHIKPRIPEGIKTLLGAEVHFTGINVAEYEDICSLAIEGTKYILIEFPFTTVWDKSLLRTFSDFVFETEYTPIIAHAERYPEIRKRPSIINELIDMGCLIQVNIGSFMDKQEKKLAYAILQHGMMHCMGTDAHDMGNRAPRWDEVLKMLKDEGYEEEINQAQDIMKKVVAGEQVRVQAGLPIKKVLWKYV